MLGGQACVGSSTSNWAIVDYYQTATNAISGYAHVATLHMIVPPNWYYQAAIGANGYINQWIESYVL